MMSPSFDYFNNRLLHDNKLTSLKVGLFDMNLALEGLYVRYFILRALLRPRRERFLLLLL